MCFLETAANPYVTILGTPETAERRLNLAQSFNGLGAFISAMFLSKLVLSGASYTRDTIPSDYPGMDRIHSVGNGCDETSLSYSGHFAYGHCCHIYLFATTEDW